MDILIDTNVILNYITEREDPFRESSKKIMKLCAEEKVNGYIAFHSLSIIWYILRKKSDNEKRFWLKNICEILIVVGATHEQVLEAINQVNFTDFEDCLQDKCAQNIQANYIVTCNINDFKNAYTKVINPEEFIKIFEQSKN
ncbi:PIN domain-containing protein [bacterium]|nr:PIN domain-containing protein [bacterium]